MADTDQPKVIPRGWWPPGPKDQVRLANELATFNAVYQEISDLEARLQPKVASEGDRYIKHLIADISYLVRQTERHPDILRDTHRPSPAIPVTPPAFDPLFNALETLNTTTSEHDIEQLIADIAITISKAETHIQSIDNAHVSDKISGSKRAESVESIEPTIRTTEQDPPQITGTLADILHGLDVSPPTETTADRYLAAAHYLGAVAAIETHIEEARQIQAELALAAHRNGVSWKDVGQLFGITGSAAYRRFDPEAREKNRQTSRQYRSNQTKIE